MNFKFDGDRLFLTSDTHFNHTNILRYCNRPFKTVGQMNETIITNWNNVVGPDDESSISETSVSVELKSGIRFLTV